MGTITITVQGHHQENWQLHAGQILEGITWILDSANQDGSTL